MTSKVERTAARARASEGRDFRSLVGVLWGMGYVCALLPGWRLAGLTAAVWFAGEAAGKEHQVLHWLVSLGLLGVFLVSIVDSSFVPLPLPGVTDVMVILFAANHANVWLLVGAATAGSALGGLFSYQVGQSGGMAFIEKRTPKRIFKRVTGWMEHHAILAVSVPALLPPPMPLSPFVLAAGALKMSRKKFMWAFTISRLVRHGFAAWLGVHYGRAVLVIWNKFIARWGTPVLVVIWVAILGSVGFAFWQLWKQSHAAGIRGGGVGVRPAKA